MHKTLVLAALSFLLPGCYASMLAPVRTRAAFDLACPEHDVRVEHLGGLSYGATGCGCRAAYVIGAYNRVTLDSIGGACTVQPALAHR